MKSLKLPPVSSNGLSDGAYRALRKAILRGELRPGNWLVESVIAEHMQISRGPIREALKRLRQEGLVKEVPRKGKQVTVLTEGDVRELHVLRALFEGHAVRLLCTAGRRQTAMIRLQRTLVRMRKAALAGNMAQFSQMDFAFHQEIMISAGMPRLYQLWSSLNGLLFIWLLTVQDSVRRLLEEVLNDHLNVVKAVAAGDEPLAEQLVRDHIVARGDQMLHGARQVACEPVRAVPPRRRLRRVMRGPGGVPLAGARR